MITQCPNFIPAAPKFRALCLGVATDNKGKEITVRAGIYDTEKYNEVVNYDANGCVVSVTKEKRQLALPKDAAKTMSAHDKAMAKIRGDLAEEVKPEVVEAKLCNNCVQEYNPELTECPNCKTERN